MALPKSTRRRRVEPASPSPRGRRGRAGRRRHRRPPGGRGPSPPRRRRRSPPSARGRRPPLPDRRAARAHRAARSRALPGPRPAGGRRPPRRAGGRRQRRRAPARPSRAKAGPRRGSPAARLPPPPSSAGRPRSGSSARLARRGDGPRLRARSRARSRAVHGEALDARATEPAEPTRRRFPTPGRRTACPSPSPPAPEGSQWACTRSAPAAARRAARAKPPSMSGSASGQIWAPAEVPRHPRAVGDAVVPEARRRDDLHLDPALPQVLDLVGDEEAGDVPGPARVRRRQDRDVQRCSRRSKTSGVASASRASA